MAKAEALTDTQKRVLEVLSAEHAMTPTQVAHRATDGNAGAAAASLRVLMRRGLVDQTELGHKGKWPLYAYRRLK